MTEIHADAPGRVNLIGEHTDYHDGFVLPCAIPQRTHASVLVRGDRRVRLWSAQMGPDGREYVLGEEARGAGWIDYVQGITWVLAQQGFSLQGFDLRLSSDVPLGSGLSSSAALEVSTLRALRAAFGLPLADVELARTAQRVETDFVGAPVGIMDQMASTLAGERDALFLDTRSLQYQRIPLPDRLELVVIDSGVTHQHAGGDYVTRRRESEDAARLLGVTRLRDVSLDALPRIEALPPLLARRARHIVTENDRVLRARAALLAGDLDALGRLLNASHASMRDDYEVSIEPVDRLVDAAAALPDVFGARMTGGGFGGAVVIAAAAGSGRDVAAQVEAEYRQQTGRIVSASPFATLRLRPRPPRALEDATKSAFEREFGRSSWPASVYKCSPRPNAVNPVEDDPSERTVFFSRGAFDVAPVADPMGHYLVVLEGTNPGKRLEIGSESITIGRGAGKTLVVDDGDVSRLHARVTLVNGTVIVEDLQSTNGTFVDAARITGAATLKEGSMLRLGGQVIKYERRSRNDIKKAQELDRDIRKASDYVASLLPTPIASGSVRTEWRFVPSAQLGGDAFGYYWLDPGTFVFYLVDVSGHGVGAAMHSVTVLNVLRQRALPGVDFKNPSEVLASLNDRFPSDSHGGLYFTMWYGVYRTADRTLTYGSAGHGPAFLVPADKSDTQPLGVPALMIGLLPAQPYDIQQSRVPEGSTLFLFSDGAYEIVTKTDDRWELSNFLPLLKEPAVPGISEPDRVYQAVKKAAAPGPLEDDFSLVAVTFP